MGKIFPIVCLNRTPLKSFTPVDLKKFGFNNKVRNFRQREPITYHSWSEIFYMAAKFGEFSFMDRDIGRGGQKPWHVLSTRASGTKH